MSKKIFTTRTINIQGFECLRILTIYGFPHLYPINLSPTVKTMIFDIPNTMSASEIKRGIKTITEKFGSQVPSIIFQ